MIRPVQGSFSQGNIVLLRKTAGFQCACNALFSICWSVIRNICNWMTSDLDHILMEGDKLHKSLDIQNYLNVEDLPRKIVFFSHNVFLEISEKYVHEGILVQIKNLFK